MIFVQEFKDSDYEIYVKDKTTINIGNSLCYKEHLFFLLILIDKKGAEHKVFDVLKLHYNYNYIPNCNFVEETSKRKQSRGEQQGLSRP